MDPISFIHELSYDKLSSETIHATKRLLIDNLGVCITGRQTKLTQIMYDYAATVYSGNDVSLWLDGRSVSLPGAALAHAYACDSVDMHDGFARSDGHPGAAIIPAVFALMKEEDGTIIDGKELITTTVVAYEICIRAGSILHATSNVYHSSGAWNAIGVAAAYSRRFKLTHEQTRHALGIAEYNAPRSLVMRCVDYPTMLKDGSGWGAMTGMSAGMLAKSGFTGAPATTVEVNTDKKNLENEVAMKEWQDLGSAFALEQPRIKQYPVCFWAQAPIYAALVLQERHKFCAKDIVRIQVVSFEQAMHLHHPAPQSTEIAQYSLSFAVAVALVQGRITAKELDGDELRNEQVLRLSRMFEFVEDDQMSKDYYDGRCACRITVELSSGKSFTSKDTVNIWSRPTDAEMNDKFRTIAVQTLHSENVDQILTLLWGLEGLNSIEEINLLLQDG